MTCATCIHRWYGEAEGQIAKWRCRKNLTLKRHQLPIIGTDAELKKSKGCKEHKIGKFAQ